MLNAQMIDEVISKSGGNKKKIAQMAQTGMIDPTTAVLAGMKIDRIRNAAQAEQVPTQSVAEQVMNPQPQMGNMGMGALPQAQQMPQAPMPAQMPQQPVPQAAPAPQQPQPMAQGGVAALDYLEQGYAPGGLVSFQDAGSVQDQLQAQSRALIEALQRSRDPQERRAIQDRLRQLTSAVSVAPPGLVTEPLAPQGDGRTGLANLDALRDMEADATARFNYAQANPVDFADIGVSDTGIPEGQFRGVITGKTPSEKVLGTGEDVYGQGIESFAPGMVERAPQGERIDPERFRTGMLTEEEARRIAANRAQPDQSVDFGNVEVSDAGIPEGEGLMGLVRKPFEAVSEAGKRFADEGGRAAVTSAKDSVMRALGLAEEPDAYTGATQKVSELSRITDPEEIARLEATPEGIAQADKATTTPAPTETPNVVDQISAANEQSKAVDEVAKEAAPDDFLKQIQDLMKPGEKGQFRKEMEALVNNREQRLKEAKRDAFSMALLQAGLGMLGQEGGQTALQALGKASLPAVKTAAESIKDAKKEDRELLQLGVAMENMDEKQQAEVKKVLVEQLGKDRANKLLRDTQVLTSKIAAQSRIEAAGITQGAQKDMANAIRIQTEMANLAEAKSAVADRFSLNRGDVAKPLADARKAYSNDPSAENAQRLRDAEMVYNAELRKAYDSAGITALEANLNRLRGSIPTSGTESNVQALLDKYK